MKIPKELKSLEDKIKSTIKPFISIKATPKDNLDPSKSKFGGNPYLLLNEEYPKAKNGKPLIFLAQINFEEVPSFDGLPSSGLLQFFVADDDLYGLNFDNKLDGDFLVRYIQKVESDKSKLLTDFSKLDLSKNYLITKQSKLTFKLSEAGMFLADIHFKDVYGKDEYEFFKQFDNEEEIRELFFNLTLSSGHKLGGYPFFTQADPRYGKKYKDYTLLFQMDSDSKAGVTWGDNGVCNFFIKKKDLEDLNFSNILYNWDCY